jgi:hypothetical protein
LIKKKSIHTYLFLTIIGLLLIAPVAQVSAQTEWNLQVTNLGDTTANYSYNQLLAMPQTTVYANELCYGGSVASGNWVGVSLSYLLQQAGLTPAVASIDFQAQDGYAVILPVQEAMQSDVIIAYELNGSPLPETLRLVVPEENGNIWIALITSITMSTNVVQSASGGGGTEGAIPSSSPTVQSSTPPVQQPSTTPQNQTQTETGVLSSNTTQPEQKTTAPQTPLSSSFPSVALYAIAVAAAAGFAAAGFTAYKRKRANQSVSLP